MDPENEFEDEIYDGFEPSKEELDKIEKQQYYESEEDLYDYEDEYESYL